jgi:hypothetical protein
VRTYRHAEELRSVIEEALTEQAGTAVAPATFETRVGELLEAVGRMTALNVQSFVASPTGPGALEAD